MTEGPSIHPVLGCVATVAQAVKDVAGVDPIFMSVTDKKAALVGLARVTQDLESLRLSVLAASEALGDVADDTHARTAGEWAARQTGRDPGAGRRDARFARDLDALPRLREAVARSAVSLDQARVVITAIRELDRHAPDLDPTIRDKALDHLITAAAIHTPEELRILGAKILDVVDPTIAEDYERRRLAAEEAHARRVSYLTMRRRGDGTTDLRGRIADALATRLRRYLAAYSNPRRDTTRPGTAGAETAGAETTGSRDHGNGPSETTYPERQGQALQSFLESVDPLRLPLHGGDATRVVVTISLDAIRDQLREGGHIGDEPLSPGQVRRLACQAGIIPAVLGGESEVLDLGRSQRLFSPAQRRAKTVGHPTCQALDCTIPAAWCEAHHRDPWSRGGLTDLDDLLLLCARHHHHAHLESIETDVGTDGVVRFHRRT